MEIPKHPRIQYLGYVDEHDKFSLISGCEVMLMPSRYESLSIVTLEGMAMGKPLVVNARCEVLRGHCERSNAALPYRNYEEFAKRLLALHRDPGLRRELGERGQAYVEAHYNWPDVERRYREFIESLLARPSENGRDGNTMEKSTAARSTA
jgi:glycosyltransferase involved in cell wall biosynthesis